MPELALWQSILSQVRKTSKNVESTLTGSVDFLYFLTYSFMAFFGISTWWNVLLKKDKGQRVLISSWSQQALTGKTEQQEASLPSAKSKWIQLLKGSSGAHLGCPWNYTFFPPQGECWCWKSCVGPIQNTSSTCKILHLFRFAFSENLEFHLYFIYPRVMLYLFPTGF